MHFCGMHSTPITALILDCHHGRFFLAIIYALYDSKCAGPTRSL
jgi:hypothetical protein